MTDPLGHNPAPESAPLPEWELLARALEADAAEAPDPAALASWMAAHPEDAAFAALVKERMRAPEPTGPSAEATERALAAVRARMERPALRVQGGGAAAQRRVVSPSVWRRWRVPLAAAAVLALAALGVFRGSGGPLARPGASVTLATGRTDTLSLPDGSQVVLGPSSTVRLADDFGQRARVVALDGVAHFIVRHDDRLPFVVRAGGAEVRDVGTAFTVKVDRAGGVAVAVSEGVVELRAARRTGAASAGALELRAGDRGDLAPDGAVTATRGVVDSLAVAWTRGVLSYRDAPLREVQADLHRWYGLELQVSDSLLARRTLTASFTAGSSAQVLRVVALALGADVLERGDTVVLLPQGIVPPPAP